MVYLKLFLEFFRIGLFTFGGSYAMVPLLEEVVVSNGWISENQFYNFIGVCESTPGPIAVNMATFVGTLQGGMPGAICATLGMVLPSFIIILIIAMLFKNFLSSKVVQKVLLGIKPIILGLILSAGILLMAKMAGYHGKNEFSFDEKSVVIFLSLVLIYFGYKKITKKKMGSILFIGVSAILGLTIMILWK